ncbi:MAG: VOC family protein, partial [Alphaproteobacteria bacterium]|nr:VOC family protein [Alphaproteobacteria bacterium]
GAVHVAPRDIPQVGRFAVVADPQKAVFALFKEANRCDEAPPAQDAPGRVGWNELHAADGGKAFAFYGEMFGWRKADAIDMGAMGTYQIFAAGDQPLGGMFTKPPMEPVPYWLYYVNVPDIDAAVPRVTSGGGQVLNGPMEVPGGSWIVQARDPQGAMFAIVGKRQAKK